MGGFFESTAGVSLAALGAVVLARGKKCWGHRVAKRVPMAAGWQPNPQQIGATLPLCDTKDGMTRWDPVGFCNDGTEETFLKYRNAEIKHGRVAMVAVVGLVNQHFWHIKNFVTSDGVTSMADVPNGIGALETPAGAQGFALLFLLAGWLELVVLKAPAGSKPWEFGDPAGLRKQLDYTGVEDTMLQTYEIEHGRLAMFGIIGTLAAEYNTGYDAVEQWEHCAEGASKLFKYALVFDSVPA